MFINNPTIQDGNNMPHNLKPTIRVMINDLMNDRISEAAAALHACLVSKSRQVTKLGEMIFDDEERERFNDRLNDAKENGIFDEVRASLAKAFRVAGGKVELDRDGGGGYENTHSYEATIHLKAGSDFSQAVRKFSLEDELIESSMLEIDSSEVQNGELLVRASVHVTFVDDEEDSEEDDEDSEDDYR